MKDIILFLVLAILIHSCTSTKEKNQVTVLGTVHFPTANINSDSIYQVLKKIRPDFILMELDTMFFDKDYSFSQTLDENEFKAVAKYVEEFPTVNVRPIEFKGRNSYRKKIGIYSDASLVFRNFNNINRSKTYTNEEQRKWDRFVHFWSKSTAIDTTDLRGLNNPKSDNIIDSLMHYQYKELNKITDRRPEFENQNIQDAKGDTITLREYYTKWTEFEGFTRNSALAQNTLNVIKENTQSTFIILTGYKHRFYIMKVLKKKQDEMNFCIKEFYDY